jgi:hypothetical protein
MSTLERCEICDGLTGGAGRLDDSLVCCNCDKVICPDCQVDGLDEIVLCNECAKKIVIKEST